MKTKGSEGEHRLQKEYHTEKRALSFYKNQMLEHLNIAMREFISRQEMAFIATSDLKGECDCSFRGGPPGFVKILNETTMAYPEYRGNGVHASLGNIQENPHVGMMFVDFVQNSIGLHVNGKARIVDAKGLKSIEGWKESCEREDLALDGQDPERWVVVEVEEAYIHCSKHIPLFKKLDKDIHWGTDEEVFKGGDFFKVKNT